MSYSLENIIYHLGNMDSGHYVNGILHNKEWYLIDDSVINTLQNINNINNGHEYILVYSLSTITPL